MEADRTAPPSETAPAGRIGIASERAFTAKLTLFAGAAVSFGVAMVLVAASHPAGTGRGDGATPSGSVAPSSSLDDPASGDGFRSGELGGSSQSSPDFSTRSS